MHDERLMAASLIGRSEGIFKMADWYSVVGFAIVMFGVIFQSLGCLRPVSGQFNPRSIFNSGGNFADTFGKLFSAANSCEFSCTEGYKRVKNSNHVPSANGCGAYGVKVSLEQIPKITQCCNNHDVCYDTCGSDKDLCDHQLKKCAMDVCESLTSSSQQSSCKSLSEVIYGSTAVLGCAAFMESQKKACLCQPITKSGQKHQEL